jgi:hypothetical protein
MPAPAGAARRDQEASMAGKGRLRRFRCARWWCVLVFVLVSSPAVAQQDPSLLLPFDGDIAATTPLPARGDATPGRAAEPAPSRPASLVAPARPRFPLLGSMYASFVALQVADVHSTSRALGAGAREANPMLPFAGNTAAMYGVKAASSAATIYLVNRIARQNRTAAIVLMAAFNSAYSVIVAHNYRLAGSIGR